MTRQQGSVGSSSGGVDGSWEAIMGEEAVEVDERYFGPGSIEQQHRLPSAVCQSYATSIESCLECVAIVISLDTALDKAMIRRADMALVVAIIIVIRVDIIAIGIAITIATVVW